ncbi:aminoglycoside phosphotransferase family protein [Burkholderia sp. WAC0059]|uniref:aminoglycoside phosphotransferase family protein n=1 Tax=Burkholderia sp. WAC0059 TaxID=2066022 RepID=UPI000C7F65FF|nr:aminoglycoside phosphotransferase family protein [Burkholderia sp. WAC0059]PLZ01919.1 aminoglycoside phosphotransferase family protein [Burkholderia sp. WAC0059]
MNGPLDDAVTAFCERCGVRGPFEVEPVGGGRNSRVVRISNEEGRWILKRYYQRAPQAHDRLGAETAFLGYLRGRGIANVAEPLGIDRALQAALYTCLPGERPRDATDDFVAQAAQFVVAINAGNTAAETGTLARAADACMQWDDHLALTRARIAQLTGDDAGATIERQAHAFVAERIAPAWRELETTLAGHQAGQHRVAPILSPSDFGLHNALAHNGRLSFVDFEYAGWDDPVKLACDFICQPEIPVSLEQGRQFVGVLARGLAPDSGLAGRVALLLPAHRLKWCCILLNEFRTEHRRRRIHAGLAQDGLLASQLDKASRYFERHFEHIEAF